MTATTTVNVNAQQAYEWVKTGVWSLSRFREWVAATQKASYDTGYKDGHEDGANGFDMDMD